MPTPLDFAFLFVATVVLVGFATFVYFPRFRAAALAGVPGIRPRTYRRTSIGQWLCAFAVLTIWSVADRPWRELGLVPPTGTRLWVSVGLVILFGAFFWLQARTVRRASAEEVVELEKRLADLSFLLPHTREEARWFTVLSVTAGICEELLYRGYLVWVLAPFVGVIGGLAIGVALFAVGHAYQGWRGVLKTGVAGAVMSAVVLATGWLIPAMVLHALVDFSAGVVGLAVLGKRA